MRNSKCDESNGGLKREGNREKSVGGKKKKRKEKGKLASF